MKVLVVVSDPDAAGLSARCAEAACQGIVDGHSPVRVVNLSDLKIARCVMCDSDGWGSCRSRHYCEIKDDFQPLHETVKEAQGYVFITTTFFGAPDEAMRAFLDRLRRCEATKERGKSALFGKPVVCVATCDSASTEAAGALVELSQVMKDLDADIFDLIPVTPRTHDYQLETIHDALSAMVSLPPARNASEATRRQAAAEKKRHTRRRKR